MLYIIDAWFNLNYEKIWLITCVIAIILFIVGLLSGSELIYGVGEDVTDFYDEILSE